MPGDTGGDGPCSGTTPISNCPYNFFRSSGDIGNNWGSMYGNLQTTTKFQGDPPLARPGTWAYPDMMEVGRMASTQEDRTHFGTRSESRTSPNLLAPPYSCVRCLPSTQAGGFDRAHLSLAGAWVITSSPLILGYDLNDESITDRIWPATRLEPPSLPSPSIPVSSSCDRHPSMAGQSSRTKRQSQSTSTGRATRAG